MQSKRVPAKNMALGGILAALAVLVMSMGTLIPVATFAAPLLCILLAQTVMRICGKRTAWAWYGAVAILAMLLAPDKEAAAVFAALGYYPIIKPWMDRRKPRWLWKGVYFNGVILSLYWALMHLFGMDQLTQEFSGMGIAMTVVLLLLGNVTFCLMDRMLSMRLVRRK